MPHRCRDEEEEKKARTVTTFAVDYMYATEQLELLTKEEVDQGKTWIGRPIMICCDSLTGGVFAHHVKSKGVSSGWPVKKMKDDIVECGYGGARIRLRSDQESPIKDLVSKVVESRPGITVPEHSAVGDSKGNGMVANCCRRVQGMMRTLRSTVESKTGIKLTSNMNIV